MDVEKEIHSLSAETLAYRCVLFGVFSKLAKIDPGFRKLVGEGFEQAVDMAQTVALQFGATASPEHTGKALKIIEELRKGILGDDELRHLV